MKIKTSFDIRIKPIEFLCCMALIIIVALIVNGNVKEACTIFTKWMQTVLNGKVTVL